MRGRSVGRGDGDEKSVERCGGISGCGGRVRMRGTTDVHLTIQQISIHVRILKRMRIARHSLPPLHRQVLALALVLPITERSTNVSHYLTAARRIPTNDTELSQI